MSILREAGVDVGWVRTDSPGVSDQRLIDRASREGRVLITFDKDFGELAVSIVPTAGFGIVLIRVAMDSSGIGSRMIAQALLARSDWEGCFSVLEVDRIRMKPLGRE